MSHISTSSSIKRMLSITFAPSLFQNPEVLEDGSVIGPLEASCLSTKDIGDLPLRSSKILHIGFRETSQQMFRPSTSTNHRFVNPKKLLAFPKSRHLAVVGIELPCVSTDQRVQTAGISASQWGRVWP